MDLTVVVPLYNEAESVRPLHDSIHAALDEQALDYEILLVDDGSEDATGEMAAALAGADARLRVISFRRNYGQTAAMVAGIEHARGRIIVTMDGDLQNDPADIPLFLEKLAQGYDVVVGWRHRRQDRFLSRRLPSVIANWLLGKVTGVPVRDSGCSLKAYRTAIIQRIPLYSEMHRFIPAMSSLAGTRTAEIRVRHHARRFGRSKYGLSRIWKVLLDLVAIKLILSFLARPLTAFALMAGACLAAALLALGVDLYEARAAGLGGTVVLPGVALLYTTLAISLVFCGVLAELVYRTGSVKIDSFARLKLEVRDGEAR